MSNLHLAFDALREMNVNIDNPIEIEINCPKDVYSKKGEGLIYIYKDNGSDFMLYVYMLLTGEFYLINKNDCIELKLQDDLHEKELPELISYFSERFCKKNLREMLHNFTPIATKFYSFGVPPLDEKAKGIYMKSLTLVTGRSNSGKTYYSLKFMQSFIKQGLNVDYLNLEMPQDKMLEEFHAAKIVIPESNISSLISKRGETLHALMDMIRIRTQDGVQVFIVDWLDRLIPRSPNMNPTTIPMQQAFIVDNLSSLAYELNIAIIVLNQVNKSTVPANGIIDWYNASAGSSQVYNICDTFIGLFDRSTIKPEARDNKLLEFILEFHIDKVRDKAQRKGIVLAKSCGKMVRALNFEEQYAYEETYYKKSVFNKTKSAATSAENQRFKELEKQNQEWAAKLDASYTGKSENTPF